MPVLLSHCLCKLTCCDRAIDKLFVLGHMEHTTHLMGQQVGGWLLARLSDILSHHILRFRHLVVKKAEVTDLAHVADDRLKTIIRCSQLP